MKKTRPLHLLLISTVAGITGADQASADNAAFAARLATEGAIPADHLTEVLRTIQGQIPKVDGDFADMCHHHLGQAEAGVQAQMKAYQTMFVGDLDVAIAEHDGVDPVIAAASLNGHDSDHATG
ncbi:MAG: hypothetical protein WDZ56_00645 [Candidatus Paceibacterota bacterium]